MKKKTVQRLFIVVITLGLMGCTAFQLRDANGLLASHYHVKYQAVANKDWRMLETAKAALSNLADESYEQAQDENNVLNKIAFYRVAATAAWQAGSRDVISYANEGTALCNDENFDRAPRDCGMLLVIPVFAGVDETTDNFNALQDKITKSPPNDRSSYAGAAEKILSDYSNNLEMILKHRAKLAGSDAHPDFLEAVDGNSGMLLCKLIESNTVGLIATARGEVAKAKCNVYKLKESALEAGLDKTFAGCLPESKDELVKPEGCR